MFRAEYASLVRSNTKFWNMSGIDVQIGANGFELHAGTLESLLVGGITFGQPEGALTAPAVADGETFILYDSVSDTKKFVMKDSLPYLLLFTGSVRGLNEDAPVDFRGVRIGTVKGVKFRYLPNDPERRVPVLIQIDPGLITDLPKESTEPAEKFIEEAVRGGLRASLKTGSLITGQMYVDLDFQKDAPAADGGGIDGYRVLPTGGSSLAELQDKASALLDKLQGLPLGGNDQERDCCARLDQGHRGGSEQDHGRLRRERRLVSETHRDVAPARRNLAIGPQPERHDRAETELAHLRQARPSEAAQGHTGPVGARFSL